MLVIDNAIKYNLFKEFAHAGKRLFLLDYDGSLMPFSSLPSYAVPDSDLLNILERLSSVPTNEVYIVSGRDSRTLDKWLGHLPIRLVAEHGAVIRKKNGTWQSDPNAASISWRQEVERIMSTYMLKCPHSFIEKKEFSLAWHYRNVEEEIATANATALYAFLLQKATEYPLTVLNGHKVIEVKNSGYNKGTAVERLIKEENPDLILAIGDDKTDEDMFEKLADLQNAVTIKVGESNTSAKYRLQDIQTVRDFLRTLATYAQ